MSLARAFTRKGKKTDSSSASTSSPIRAFSLRKPADKPINRSMISAPVALISTTNMLSYNAPDIATYRHVSSSSASSHSSDDSDHSSTFDTSSPGLTDASSVESSPISPEPNHLSCYFPPIKDGKARRAASLTSIKSHRTTSSVVIDVPAPVIPQRAPSHSKQAHERLARKRSMQTVPPNSLHLRGSSYSSARTSADMFDSGLDVSSSHPFGKELEQLNEIVEEFGGVVRDSLHLEEIAFMEGQGLAKFDANAYMHEIECLWTVAFNDDVNSAPVAWI